MVSVPGPPGQIPGRKNWGGTNWVTHVMALGFRNGRGTSFRVTGAAGMALIRAMANSGQHSFYLKSSLSGAQRSQVLTS